MKAWIVLCCLLLATPALAQDAKPVPLSVETPPGETFMQIRLLGTVKIPARDIDGQHFQELSGLAWDEDEGLLYAVSDKGALFHLKPLFRDGRLVDVKLLKGYPLRGKHGKILKGKHDDSEGIDIIDGDNGKHGDTRLIISFEVKPRIKRYNPRGQRLGDIRLPVALRTVENYHARNDALESVAVHPKFGILTAPEVPLKRTDPWFPTLYSTTGKQWRLPKRAGKKTSIVGMDTFADGSLLILERAYRSLVEPVVITLKQIWLNDDCEGHKARHACRARTLAVLDTSKGWSIDNFEGLTRYRGNRFFMISDNNNFWFQRTLLSFFEVLPVPGLDGPDQPKYANPSP